MVSLYFFSVDPWIALGLGLILLLVGWRWGAKRAAKGV